MRRLERYNHGIIVFGNISRVIDIEQNRYRYRTEGEYAKLKENLPVRRRICQIDRLCKRGLSEI